MMRAFPALIALAASTYSISRTVRIEARMRRAGPPIMLIPIASIALCRLGPMTAASVTARRNIGMLW
jgi:hypothetical protein